MTFRKAPRSNLRFDPDGIRPAFAPGSVSMTRFRSVLPRTSVSRSACSAGSVASLAVLGRPRYSADHADRTRGARMRRMSRALHPCRCWSMPTTAYGNALNVRRTVQELEDGGARRRADHRGHPCLPQALRTKGGTQLIPLEEGRRQDEGCAGWRADDPALGHHGAPPVPRRSPVSMRQSRRAEMGL